MAICKKCGGYCAGMDSCDCPRPEVTKSDSMSISQYETQDVKDRITTPKKEWIN